MRQRATNENGSVLIEGALLCSLIAIACIGSLGSLGANIELVFREVSPAAPGAIKGEGDDLVLIKSPILQF